MKSYTVKIPYSDIMLKDLNGILKQTWGYCSADDQAVIGEVIL